MRDGNGGKPEAPAMPDPTDLEQAIRRIQGVQAARVVPGPGGRVSEVHVLAGRERGAKQLVRDVQSVILTNFGVDIDYRTVSIVQLDETPPPVVPGNEEEPPRPGPASAAEATATASARPAISRIATDTASFTTEVQLSVRLGSSERSGTARGTSTSALRLVASAAIDAVSGLLPASAADVTSAEVLTVGGMQIAVVVLRLSTDRGEQSLTGSAIVRKDASDAIARATLDALNRVISER